MITKRETYLIAVIFLMLVIIIGGTLNFLAITKNQGKMPILISDPNLIGYEDNEYFTTASCEGIKYCFAIDRFGGAYFGYLIKASAGDFIILAGYVGSVIYLIKWRRAVRKEENERK
jgi:hypothetical protein